MSKSWNAAGKEIDSATGVVRLVLGVEGVLEGSYDTVSLSSDGCSALFSGGGIIDLIIG